MDDQNKDEIPTEKIKCVICMSNLYCEDETVSLMPNCTHSYYNYSIIVKNERKSKEIVHSDVKRYEIQN